MSFIRVNRYGPRGGGRKTLKVKKKASVKQEWDVSLGRIICSFSLVAQLVKSLPAMRETWVLSLGQEDPLEKGMATYSSILAWRIPWIEEPSGLQSMGSQRVGQ